mgnify:FL=1
MLKVKRRLQAIYSLFNKAPFWVEIILLMAVIALVVFFEILVQDNNTLLPICIPWMYDRFAMCVISILLAFIKKISGKSKEEFGSIFGGYCIKTALCFILIPALILLPNKYLPSTILVKEKYGVVIDLASIKINKSTSSRQNYVKIKLDNEDISFWYDTYKETKPLGTKCIMNIKRGFFGLRYADNVDFLVE